MRFQRFNQTVSNINTKISGRVRNLEAEYLISVEQFEKRLPVAKSGIADDESSAAFVVVTDVEFAEERLKVAKKHYRDYGEIPDKGQFPYISRENDVLVFTGQHFIPNQENAIDSGKLKEI